MSTREQAIQARRLQSERTRADLATRTEQTRETLQTIRELRDQRAPLLIYRDEEGLQAKKSRRGILGGPSVDLKSLLNQQFLPNPRCKQLWTNQLYVISSNNSVAFGDGINIPVNQGTFAVSIGSVAGFSNQGEKAVAIGGSAGFESQASEAVAIGFSAGKNKQAYDTVMIGSFAGTEDSSLNSVNIGYRAGAYNQAENCTSVGAYAGDSSQGIVFELSPVIQYQGGCTSVGYMAGKSNQYGAGTSVGFCASAENASGLVSSIGSEAGCINTGYGSSLIGARACHSGLGDISSRNVISIGCRAGEVFPGLETSSIGFEAGRYYQGETSIAIGSEAGKSNQKKGSVAIGYQSGMYTQGQNSIAIGYQAGYCNQGSNCIAIGSQAGKSNQHDGSVILNASGVPITSTANNRLFINPIRLFDVPGSSGKILQWDSTTKEVTRNSSKSFIIPHPHNQDKYLVHACIEGPEAGVYYRGKGEITNGTSSIVKLPSYVNSLASEFTIHLTPYVDYSDKVNESFFNIDLEHSEILDNEFTVFGTNCKFSYLVFGKRFDIEVEPLKKDYILKGDGPYTYLEKIN